MTNQGHHPYWGFSPLFSLSSDEMIRKCSFEKFFFKLTNKLEWEGKSKKTEPDGQREHSPASSKQRSILLEDVLN